jgi:hypothetical protein
MEIKGKKLLALGLVWLCVTAIGFFYLNQYANKAGTPATVASTWPVGSSLVLPNNMPTLVMFLHPMCPCSEASVAELARLLPSTLGKMRHVVLFYQPKSKTAAWTKSTLWQDVAKMPGVEIITDWDGLEADIFGSKTSGQVYVYDSNGVLAYSGGITPSRGHMGDSPGRAAILSIAKNQPNSIQTADVFGCSLKNPQRSVAQR